MESIEFREVTNEREEIRSRLIKYMNETTISINNLAIRIGTTSPLLSRFLRKQKPEVGRVGLIKIDKYLQSLGR